MRSFTSRPGYHASSYDAASHGRVVKLHFQFMKRQLHRDGKVTSRWSLLPEKDTRARFRSHPVRIYAFSYTRVFRSKKNLIE